MKPKQQRQHYARKRKRLDDPDTYCGRNPYAFNHQPGDAVWGSYLDDDQDAASLQVKFTTRCRHCDARIEFIQYATKISNDGIGWDVLPWRRELFIIEETPY